MIKKVKGDLLSVQSGYIVHGCNAEGKMCAGVALQIKKRRPAAWYAYKKAFKAFQFAKRSMLGTNSISVCNVTNRVIVNAVTQESTGRDGKQYTDYDAVKKCFAHINRMIMDNTFPNMPKEVNFPMIGCGLGGGNWDVVSDIIDETLDKSIKKILWIYE